MLKDYKDSVCEKVSWADAARGFEKYNGMEPTATETMSIPDSVRFKIRKTCGILLRKKAYCYRSPFGKICRSGIHGTLRGTGISAETGLLPWV